MWSRPCARSQPLGAPRAAAAGCPGRPRTRGSRTSPSGCRGSALKASSYCALMRPTTRPSRRGEEQLRVAVREERVHAPRMRNSRRSSRSGGTHTPELECSRYGSSMNSRRSRHDATGRTTTLTEADPTCRPPSTSSRRSAGTSAPSSCGRPARPTCSPTSAALEGPAGPGGRDGGRRADHARLQQLPRADRRPARACRRARDALDRYGTGLTGSRLLNGTLDLHLRARGRARGVDGHRGGDRLLHRPPGQRRHARHDPRPRRHGDRRLRPTTPRSSTAACSRAPSCARSATTGSTSSRRCSSAPGDDGGGVLVVVDGVFSMEGDVAPLPRIVELCQAYGARLMVDEAHAARSPLLLPQPLRAVHGPRTARRLRRRRGPR